MPSVITVIPVKKPPPKSLEAVTTPAPLPESINRGPIYYPRLHQRCPRQESQYYGL